VVLVAQATGAGAQDLTITDTHIHYSRDAWSLYSPESVLGLLTVAGVQRAFVSSTPDDGTVRIHDLAPDRIVAVLRPYREAGEAGQWHRDPTVVPYLEGRLARGLGPGQYRGIGEFHLSGSEARSAVVREVADLARRHGLFLHCHCDVEGVEALLELSDAVPVLWAHAGMSAEPATVERLLERSPRLLVELALRSDVAPGGLLAPAWQRLFLRHPDRFMVGTDTWIPSRWADLPDVLRATRTWLRQLPPDVAQRIASGNAERLAAP